MNFGIKEVLDKLKKVRKSNTGYTALCPNHDDEKNSLSVSESNGKVLIKCFAGCSYQEVLSALNLSLSGNGLKAKIQFEAVYDYTDENCEVLYQNVRFESKKFRHRHFDDNGKEVWNLNGVRHVPYRLPELINLPNYKAFILTEGEKDADKLRALDLIATNHKNWKAEFNYLLKGRDVVIFQDHDRSGVQQANKVIELVSPDAKRVKVVDCFTDEPLPDKHGKDVSDYLETHSINELLELIRQTPFTEKARNNESNETGFKVVRLSDIEAKEISWLWKPFIAIGEFTILEGIEGLGKSWLTCAVACAVAGGDKLPFNDNEQLEPANVLLLSAEDSLSRTVKPRLVSMFADTDKIFAIDGVFSLQNLDDLIKFEAVIATYKPKLVVLDPMFSYTGGNNLNAESDSRPLASKLIAIAQKYNCAVVGVRHIGKSKGNGDARSAGLGSIAWRASARSVLLVGKDEETGERAICQTKTNLAEESKFSVGFEIIDGQFLWKSVPSRLTKEKMLAQPKDEETRAEQSEAVNFLLEALKAGEKPSKEVEKEARELGITTYAIKKAKAILGVKSEKKGGNFGGENCWVLRLSKSEDVAQDVGIKAFRHLQQNGSNKISYHKGLAEDVELKTNQHLQFNQTMSSKNMATCICGVEGLVDEKCSNCGEFIIPF